LQPQYEHFFAIARGKGIEAHLVFVRVDVGDLAANLEIALSTVSNFLRGVKVLVSKFEEISEALGLEARDLIQAETPDPPSASSQEVTSLPTLFA